MAPKLLLLLGPLLWTHWPGWKPVLLGQLQGAVAPKLLLLGHKLLLLGHKLLLLGHKLLLLGLVARFPSVVLFAAAEPSILPHVHYLP